VDDILREPGLIEYIGESVVIIGHHNADPDAIGAAQGVKELVQKLKPSTFVEVVMPEDISKLSRQIINELELNISEKTEAIFDTFIIVDSSGLNQLRNWENIKKKNKVTILIDHHILNEDTQKNTNLLIHDENASSTCEIVYLLYTKYNLIPSKMTSIALLAGIAFDTKYLSIGSSQTFKVVSKLLENIDNISKIRSMLKIDTDISEKIAKLKTAQRSEIHRLSDWLIVFSEVGSFQASGARALVSLGADFAAVIGSDKDGLRASLRSTQSFHTKTGIHLGELVSRISLSLGGAGSGHPTAAGYNGTGAITEFKKELLNLITEIKCKRFN
jgi:nanoRNase/pAp phosphatase (c-di-AMP/oligoRNAs hydrolase)